MTALTIDVIRLFFAFTVVVCIVTIAVVVIANTADVDSMADPTPRPGEDDNPQTDDGAVELPISSQRGSEAWSAGSPTAAGVPPPADPAPSSSTKRGPHVPDDVMRIIDAALPREQAWGKWVQYREGERQ